MRSKYADKVSDMFNACPVQFKATCSELITEHRTIQQNMTRFCMTWLKTLATDPCVGTDARNEQSVNVAKMLYSACPEAFDEPLPFI